MMEDGRLYHTFGEIEGKLDVLCVEYTKCERKKVRFGSWRVKTIPREALTQD